MTGAWLGKFIEGRRQLGARRGPADRAEFLTVAGGVRAEADQHLVRVGANPASLCLGGADGDLGAGGFLLRQPGSPLGSGESLAPIGLSGADLPAIGRRVGLGNRGIPLGFRDCDPLGGVNTGCLDLGVPVSFSSNAGCPALLGDSADGFNLGLSGGRVSHGIDGLAQPLGDATHPVGFGPQQFRAGHPGHRHRLSASAGPGATPTWVAARRRRSRQADTRVWPRPMHYSGSDPARRWAAGWMQPKERI